MRPLRPVTGPTAGDLLREGRSRERAGCMAEAGEHYQAAVTEAERTCEYAVQTEALRRLSVIRYQAGDVPSANQLCRRSVELANQIGNTVLAAEALNTLGALHLQQGNLREARETFQQASAMGESHRELLARVEQNLGVVANIQGDLDDAFTHYRRSLEACEQAGDDQGRGIALNNLGMVSTDRGMLDAADQYFQQSLLVAQATNDVLLQGLSRVNRAEVQCAREAYDEARREAEAALAIFDQLGAPGAKVDAYRVIGMVYRDTDRPALGESRLRSAIDLAVKTGLVLGEAEASRELALLYQGMGRNQEALTLLNAAHRLFNRLDARVDLVNVAGKVAELETTYLAVVRQWGESIESSDSYTFGHCERVAAYAVAVAQALGFDEQQQTAVRLGAYLHDLGKVRVPHEVLNKPGRLTNEEREIVQMHPIWGIELVATIEFPWDIKPIIRWHHEKYDGSGYPDRLHGEEIPVAAQIVGIVDVFDALTTTRSYRPAMSSETALHEIDECRRWWSPAVYQAFKEAMQTMPSLPLDNAHLRLVAA